jgi:ketosteroid isomerase-like protein
MIIDDPVVLADISAQFEAYEAALMNNDVAALDEFFWPSALAVRFGNGESLFGFAAIAAFRAARPPMPMRQLRNKQITSFGLNHGVTTTEYIRDGDERLGRQTQVWVKFPDLGWKIVSAHVSWSQA